MSASTMNAQIEVDAPVGVVYDQWTQFESFPHFMKAVESVTQLDDTRTHWVVSIGGVEREFDATITDQVPNEHIAWASVDGTTHVGEVSFTSAGDATTVTLRMTWQPESLIEKAGAALGFDERQADSDLKHFKKFLEERGAATGGWRGEVHGGTTATPTPEI